MHACMYTVCLTYICYMSCIYESRLTCLVVLRRKACTRSDQTRIYSHPGLTKCRINQNLFVCMCMCVYVSTRMCGCVCVCMFDAIQSTDVRHARLLQAGHHSRYGCRRI